MVANEGGATLGVVRGGELSSFEKAGIVQLCEEAFADDFSRLFGRRPGSIHVLAHVAGLLVGHACWVPRWLEPGGSRQLRAAWVDAVATRPSHQSQGIGRAVMQRVSGEIRDYDLGALTAAIVPFYERMGWEAWRGVVTICTDSGQSQTPEAPVMILRGRATPHLDLGDRLVIRNRQAPHS